MSKVSLKGTGNIKTIANFIDVEMQNSAFSCNLVDMTERKIGENHSILMVFEKYYMRASNRASLSVLLTSDNDVIYIDAIGAGGGQGVIFSFSWGAEDDFVESFCSILEERGFEICF